MSTAEQTAIDLLNRGGCSVAILGGEMVKRGLIGKEQSIGHAYRVARETLEALAASGRAQRWPDGICYTLPEKTTFEKAKEPA